MCYSGRKKYLACMCHINKELLEFTCTPLYLLWEYFKSLIRQFLPMIRLIELKAKFKSDETTYPWKGVFDKRCSTMSIDKNAVKLANCRLCPALRLYSNRYSCPSPKSLFISFSSIPIPILLFNLFFLL